MDLENFIPSYPIFEEDNNLKIYEGKPNDSFYKKAEFIRLEKYDKDVKGYLPHQKNLASYISPFTLNDRMLLIDSLGSGKTPSSIAIVELSLRIYDEYLKKKDEFNKAIIITKNTTIKRNFINELSSGKFTNKYIPDNVEILTKEEKKRRINKLVKQNYLFSTFEILGKQIQKLTDEYIIKYYSNRIFIMDEAHNVNELEIYKDLWRLFHVAKNIKIVLMTATPIRDDITEFPKLLNLLLPEEKQLPTSNDFVETFFKEGKLINKDKLNRNYLIGKIGFTGINVDKTLRINKGENIEGLKYLKVVVNKMKKEQEEGYLEAFSKDKISKSLFLANEKIDRLKGGLYNNSRQASLFYFKNCENYIEKVGGSDYKLNSKLRDYLTNNGKANTQEIIKNIEKCSTIYANVIREIISNPNENIFVFCKYVQNAGAILFGELLKLINFKRFQGKEELYDDSPRYALIIGENVSESQVDNILEKFNKKENVNGKIIRVIIGSGVISEGRSLKSIRQIHLLTNHWNLTETTQAIGRGLRTFSHDYLPEKERYCKIYSHIAVPKDLTKSINLLMYQIAENKDLLISQLIRLMKEVSFNCGFNYNRNILPSEYDKTRECEYKVCSYKCRNINDMSSPADITDTYNLIFADEDISKIITIISQNFRKEFAYNLNELISNFVDTPKIVIIRALKKMIDTNMIIRNKYNMISYLRESNDLYFLVDNPKIPSDYALSYYSKFPNLSFNRSFKEIIRYNQYTINLKDKLSFLLQTEKISEKEIGKNLDSLLPEIQEYILEKSLKAEMLGKSKDKHVNRIRSAIIKHYENYLLDINGRKVSTLLSYIDDKDDEKGGIRCETKEDSGVWQDCSEDILQEIEKKKEEEKVKLSENKFGYYGMIDKKKNKEELKIMIINENKDKRKENRGIKCLTIVPTGRIIEIILNINRDGYNIKLPKKYLNEIKESRSELEETILNILSNSKQMRTKEGKIKLSKNDLKKMSIEQVKSLYYWVTQATKKELCEHLTNFFKENNLIANL
jgi:superfamily II DNA or RNA helicase